MEHLVEKLKSHYHHRLRQSIEFWHDDESNEAIQPAQDWPEHDMESEQLIHINPTSGLIMMDDCMDIAGNLYGTSEIDTDFLADWISLDT
jgi:hypothetical protein